MKQKFYYLTTLLKFAMVVLLLSSLYSCRKGGKDDIPQTSLAISYLNGGAWHLISSTSVSSTGSISSYAGLPADSINFKWGQDQNQNVILTTINSFINGVHSQCNYQYILSRNLDTIDQSYYPFYLCTPSWKNGYSDTLYLDLTIVTPKFAVFKVRYNNLTGQGIETDSLGR